MSFPVSRGRLMCVEGLEGNREKGVGQWECLFYYNILEKSRSSENFMQRSSIDAKLCWLLKRQGGHG